MVGRSVADVGVILVLAAVCDIEEGVASDIRVVIGFAAEVEVVDALDWTIENKAIIIYVKHSMLNCKNLGNAT